ncbi:MAG: formyltetrahydrofolate deformylase [Verrucomicrobiales bacterium]|nr:formyltetrahydrofolate deformylase [Verrucomicrobiales bacterium]
MDRSTPTAILLVSCPDQSGLVSTISSFISDAQGNIVDLEQHVDSSQKAFFMRVEWQLDGFGIARDQIHQSLETLLKRFGMQWSLHFSDTLPQVAIFVTRDNHCLYDLLSRHHSGDLQMDIPLIISNRTDLEPVAQQFGIPFHHLPITADTKAAQEEKQIALLREHRIDTIVLARYMQILSANFVDHYPNQIINIHHSFLPAFPGARPYHSAHQRGVKIIGATGHYVTSDLDEGPIITQDVIHVSHRESVSDFIRKGKDLEKTVLSRAVWYHLQHRVLVHKNRSVVFA